jgi:hypothetical protein
VTRATENSIQKGGLTSINSIFRPQERTREENTYAKIAEKSS